MTTIQTSLAGASKENGVWWWRVRLSNKHCEPGSEHRTDDYKVLRTLLLAGIIAPLVARQVLAAVLIYGVAAVCYYTKGGEDVKEGNKGHAK